MRKYNRGRGNNKKRRKTKKSRKPHQKTLVVEDKINPGKQ